MTDARFRELLLQYRRRLRAAAASLGLVIGAAVAGVVLAVNVWFGTPPTVTRATATIALGGVALAFAFYSWRRWTVTRVATVLDARASLDNLVVTAEEVASGRSTIVNRSIRDEVFTGAVARLERIKPAEIEQLARPLITGALSVAAVLALVVAAPNASRQMSTAETVTSKELAPLERGDLRIIVTAPAYARRPPQALVNPSSVTALEGSRLRLELRTDSSVTLHEADGRETAFAPNGDIAVLELVATTSRPLLVRQGAGQGLPADRLVSLRVDADQRPGVSIREPAKDLIFASGTGEVGVHIDARDDVGLTSLALRYTRVSGSGETFTFEEGEWPLEIAREGSTSWRARATLSLEALKLQDGDTLVYRAVAKDGKPGADPSSSDTYLIEIGRLAGVAAQGFALPEERDRQAISQQMLIIKTERLHADRTKLSSEAFAEQAQLLAVEQRMVKAEFVFMTGGEVEDEVEEATHAHELAEGRLENSAQVELLTAIREMSRAEARLNAADTAQALEFERTALKALQRAFDRRRYLLRTLPERTRIDVTRRLTGELDEARSSTRSPAPAADDPVVQNARRVLSELSESAAGRVSNAVLASRVLALAPASEPLQNAALRLTTAQDDAARVDAVRQAQEAIVGLLRQRMSTQLALPLTRETLEGRLAQELAPGGTPR